MCIEVEVLHENGAVTYCDTKAALQMVLGGSLVPEDGYWPDEACLCPLDIEETAKRYGYAVEVGDSIRFVRTAGSAPGGQS